MSQSSTTTYSTGTSSLSSASATTVTSPGTSKGSWGEMMTSPPLPQPHQARPLPIPEKQAGSLDPVSLPLLHPKSKPDNSPASSQGTVSDQLPSPCQRLVDPYHKSQQISKLSPSPRHRIKLPHQLRILVHPPAKRLKRGVEE